MNSVVARNPAAITNSSKTYFPIRGWTLSSEELDKQAKDSKASVREFGFAYDPNNYHWIFSFPDDFISPSDHDKYVIFQYCRCTVGPHFHSEIEVHSTFIPRDNYCDSLVYYANLQVPDDNRKYKVNSTRRYRFDVWFTNGKGQIIKDELNFVMFLKLEY